MVRQQFNARNVLAEDKRLPINYLCMESEAQAADRRVQCKIFRVLAKALLDIPRPIGCRHAARTAAAERACAGTHGFDGATPVGT